MNLDNKKKELDETLQSEMKRHYQEGNYHLVRKMKAVKEYYDRKDKLKSPDRLEAVGNPGSIMFVGLNPAEQSNMDNAWDDLFGKELKSFLNLVGIDSSVIWLTNLWKSKTPNNRPLNTDEISRGLKELDLEINAMDPTLIVLLGNQVIDAFGGIKYDYSTYKGYKTFGMSHPSFIKRYAREDLKSEFINALEEIKQYV